MPCPYKTRLKVRADEQGLRRRELSTAARRAALEMRREGQTARGEQCANGRMLR